MKIDTRKIKDAVYLVDVIYMNEVKYALKPNTLLRICTYRYKDSSIRRFQ